VRIVLDTNVFLRALYAPERLSREHADQLSDPRTEAWFSAINIWEIAIKTALRRPHFAVDPRAARVEALDAGFTELVVDGSHAVAVGDLPDIHRDPFDRLLVAQAVSTGMTLWTTDRTVARYPAQIELLP
jgi:PIN domain nuclease of toxin-antitoxin system